jgi:ferritin-like metal-binding protein YciE
MAEVETPAALLAMALQDLLDGEGALVERLPDVEGSARDDALKALIAEDRSRSKAQRDALRAMLRELGEDDGDSPNIWLRAILDDAANDARTIAAGRLRDIALTGALRKAKQAERVSYETAMALATQLGMDEAAEDLRRIRDEEQAADEALAKGLERLAGAH